MLQVRANPQADYERDDMVAVQKATSNPSLQVESTVQMPARHHYSKKASPWCTMARSILPELSREVHF